MVILIIDQFECKIRVHKYEQLYLQYLTIPMKVRKVTTAKQKKAMKALAWISGCLA